MADIPDFKIQFFYYNLYKSHRIKGMKVESVVMQDIGSISQLF